MSKVTLTITKSSATKNGNFMNKLTAPGAMVATPFGMVEGGKRTFYMFTNQLNNVGVTAEVELESFDQVKRDYPFVDEQGAAQVASLTYLYPRRA